MGRWSMELAMAGNKNVTCLTSLRLMDAQRAELSVLVQVKLDRFQVPRDSSTMISWFSPRKGANYLTSLYMARLQDISSDLLNSTDLGRAGCGNGLNGPWSRLVKRMGRSQGELLWIYDHSWTGFSCSWPGRQQSYSSTITNHSKVSCGT